MLEQFLYKLFPDVSADAFLQQLINAFEENGPKGVEAFLERTTREIESGTRSRPEGISPIGLGLHALLGAEQLYLKLGLDKVLPVRQSIQLSNLEICHKQIPSSFDGFRILWLSDLHLDVGRTDKTVQDICEVVKGLNPDLLVWGGDYRHGHHFILKQAEKEIFARMGRITEAANPVQAVALLGNHDVAEMILHFPEAKAQPLVNASLRISRGDDALNFVGLDDSYRFFQQQTLMALRDGILPNHYNVVLAHSPHLAERAAECGANLYLAGHTHAGQLSWAPLRWIQKKYCGMNEKVYGEWQVEKMAGYTSSGIGSSAIPLRNITGEALMVTLKARAYIAA